MLRSSLALSTTTTDDSPPDEAITAQVAFSRALTALLAAAHGNGVDVGAWECRTDGVSGEWEAVATELADGRHPGPGSD